MAQEVSRLVRTKAAEFLETLSDTSQMAQAMMKEALEFAAKKARLEDLESAVAGLRKGDKTTCRYIYYGLAKVVAKNLAELAPDVKAIYLCDFDATPQDICFCEAGGASLLHLAVWTERKTAALDSLLDLLDKALVEECARMTGQEQLAHLLDVQVVDDADVKNRIGYGALLTSIHNRPVLVWER